jgi:hypothetical protein
VHKLVLPLLSPILLSSAVSPAQSASQASNSAGATLRGTIVDPSNALIPQAEIVLRSSAPGTPAKTTRSAADGRYIFTAVPAGDYTVHASAPGFALFESTPIHIASAKPQILDIRLQIETQQVQMDVSSESSDATDPNKNGSAVVLSGKALDDLPTEPTLLQEELQALSGGDSPAIYVDGFSNGAIPPKNQIREIRINQNPFSARNDVGPGNGMIEIFTKPGTDKLHGDLILSGNDSAFNTENPFTASQPAYYSTRVGADLSGPVSKKASYALNFNRFSAQTNSVVNATKLDASLANQISFTQAVPSPNTSTQFSPRLDLQLGTRSTMTFRYSWSNNQQLNGGIGQLNLPEQGYNSGTVTQVFQASNSQVFGAKVVNDTRFQYTRTRTNQTPLNTTPAIVVEGAFNGGGNNAGAFHDNKDSYELQNYIAIQAGKHYLSPGVRLRVNRDANVSRAGFNGEYTFASLNAYQAAAQALAACTIPPCQIPGASQYTVTTGNPAALIDVADVAAFFQDDWKLRKNFTLSYGLRYEIQNYISDRGDFAPRVGFAWSLGAKKNKPAPFVLRGGSGIFYTHILSPYILQAQRQNGVTQQQYSVASPAFYPQVPTAPATLGPASSPTTYSISPTFRTQYSIIGTLELDHPLGTRGNLSLQGYSNRVVHLLVPRNINSPLPGTYNPANPASGIRPFGGTQNIDEFDSIGLARSNSISLRANYRAKNGSGFYSYYMYRIRSSDANGGFPSNEYNDGADYGRGSQDVRHNFFFDLETPTLPGRITIGAYLEATSGAPFNITVGQDLNGDSQFNDRPAFATAPTANSVLYQTAYGTLDANPQPGEATIPINFGRSPAFLSLNAEIYRKFSFGPALPVPLPPPGAKAPPPAQGKPTIDRKYNLMLIVEAQNAINHVNLGTPVGVLGSSLFGQSNSVNGSSISSNANRVILLDLLVRF